MRRSETGHYVTVSTVGEACRAFVPKDLPPVPPLKVSNGLRLMLDEALVALGRLDGVTVLLPDPSLFLTMYVRKEAVLSSQIEGTQSSLSDLLLFELDEAPGVPLDDVREVSNHVAALDHAVSRLRGGFPLSSRLIREIHGVLLASGRGSEKDPGEFRRSQNWIGGSRPGNAVFVPPPPGEVTARMGALDRFLHGEPEKTPPLLKAALAHVQFESIHPFLDGNGRVGRLLIPLILLVDGVLSEPLLYPSLFFKRHRDTYYEYLQAVRKTGDWEQWVAFFAEAVRDTAADAVDTVHILTEMAQRHRVEIQAIGRSAGSVLRVQEAFLRKPVLTIPKAAEMTGLVPNTLTSCMKSLESLGLVREITGRRRNRAFAYVPYLEVLNAGT